MSRQPFAAILAAAFLTLPAAGAMAAKDASGDAKPAKAAAKTGAKTDG
jgi:hypothetical protein